MRASMTEVSPAVSETSPDVCALLESMYAFAFVRMTLIAAAPAPLMPSEARPKEAEAAAAAVHALMVAAAVDDIVIAPLAMPVSAFAMYASTSFEISLCATATAIATEPATTPTAAASDAAPVNARMVEVSPADSEMLDAPTPVAPLPSPSMCAVTRTLIRFSEDAPAPLRPMPTTPPESAADAASTYALIVSPAVAPNDSAPVAEMLVRSL